MKSNMLRLRGLTTVTNIMKPNLLHFLLTFHSFSLLMNQDLINLSRVKSKVDLIRHLEHRSSS